MVPPSLSKTQNAEDRLLALRETAGRVWHNRGGEPRWPAMVALAAVAALTFALPDALVRYPKWIPLVVVGALLIPTARAHHEGDHKSNTTWGYVLNTVLTAFLLWSVGLLVMTLSAHKESPGQLLRSAGVLWVTNVIVFALWYWRLDAGGPNMRERIPGHDTGAFLFPQMTLDADQAKSVGVQDWEPNFWDYLFLAFNTSTALSPTDTAVLDRWAKLLMMAQSAVSLVIIALLAARAINTLQ